MRIPTNSNFSREIAKRFKQNFPPRYDSWWITRFTGTVRFN